MKKLSYTLTFRNWIAANTFANNVPCKRPYTQYFILDNVIVIHIKRRDKWTIKRAAIAYKAVSCIRV